MNDRKVGTYAHIPEIQFEGLLVLLVVIGERL